MMKPSSEHDRPVVTTMKSGLTTITLNRPQRLNALNLVMIGFIETSLRTALTTTGCKSVLLRGAGERAFCAGGDVKALSRWVKENRFDSAETFFEKEYALDLLVHNFSKPVIAICDGITMGGGLGLAAGADFIIVTENSRMAMPETAIGFFPDVGATGWLFRKCLMGYPEYLGLTGATLNGQEAVRCGLATHFVRAEKMTDLVATLRTLSEALPEKKKKALAVLRERLDQYSDPPSRLDTSLEVEVQKHFHGKSSLKEIHDSLRHAATNHDFASKALQAVTGHSPTALVLTFALLRRNQGLPLENVFAMDRKAASFMIRHPDYLEGIRAQLLDKDHAPKWNPGAIDDVKNIETVLDSKTFLKQ